MNCDPRGDWILGHRGTLEQRRSVTPDVDIIRWLYSDNAKMNRTLIQDGEDDPSSVPVTDFHLSGKK